MLKENRRPRVIPSLFILLVMVIVAVHYLLRSPGAADFRLHRARYEAIVAKIKTLGIVPGERRHMWINEQMEADTLSSRRLRHEDMVGEIEVWRRDSGRYQFSIITRDEGHLGTYGYLYSEVPEGALRSTEDLPSLERRISPHWWIAYNDKW